MLRIGGGHGARAPLPTLRAAYNVAPFAGRFENDSERRFHLGRVLKRRLTCAAVRSLSKTAGKLFLAIEGAHRREAVRGDTTLPGKPLCTIRASPSAGYIRFRTASRQSAAASRRRSAELCGSTLYLGRADKRVQLRSETRGEVRATHRTRLGFFCEAEYDRCGGTECYDDQARNTHRMLRSQVRSEIIPHDSASNDNNP
jgi:hypothetical protein